MVLTGLYTWSETDDLILLRAPLKGVSPRKVDIFATECLLKVSYLPYLINLDLVGSIDPDRSKALVKNGTLILKMHKKEGHKSVWGELALNPKDPEVQQRRSQSIADRERQQQELAERAKTRKFEDERKALRSQMAAEQRERAEIEDRKSKEKEQAEEEVYKTFAELAAKQQEEKEAKEAKQLKENTALPSSGAGFNDIFAESEIRNADHEAAVAKAVGQDDIDEEEEQEEEDSIVSVVSTRDEVVEEAVPTPAEVEDVEDVHFIPAPRSTVKVSVGFSARLFPTPKRESKEAEEEEWIMKNRRHLRKNKMIAEHLPADLSDITETDPTWLKGKGDDFYRAKDYRSAISAYSAALEANSELPGCFSNRAACRLRLHQLQPCIDDCTAAIDLLKVKGGGGDQMLRLLARRGAALSKQGHYKVALDDLQAALAMAPQDQELAADAEQVRHMLDSAAVKARADAALSGGDASAACQLYSEVLKTRPDFVAALSNRAGCHLACGRLEDCVSDCTRAIELLGPKEEVPGQGELPTLSALGVASVPPHGSKQNKQFLVRTVLRRGAALNKLGRLEEALTDYRSAQNSMPEDEALAADLARLQAAWDGECARQAQQ